MATINKPIAFDKLIQEISSRYHLGPKGRSLIEEALDMIAQQPGGIGGFLERFKAAGFGAKVASWLAGTDLVPLSWQEVEQALGSKAIGEIADKAGVSQRFARTILGYAIPKIISMLAQSGFLGVAIPTASSRVDEIPQREEEQFPSGDLEDSGVVPWFRKSVARGAAPRFGRLVVPGAALVIMLGLLGYFVTLGGAGHHPATRTSPVMAQNAPVVVPPHAPSKPAPTMAQNGPIASPHAPSKSASITAQNAAVVIPHESAPVTAQIAPVVNPHAPSIPARLALSNKNGLIFYSGTVGDDTTRATIIDSLKTVFGADKITGELAVDQHAGPAGWTKDLKAALDNFKTPGSQALFEGDAVSVGGTIPDADRDRIINSLKSVLGPKYAFATIAGSGATETATAPPSGVSGKTSIPEQSALKLPTIYFATNSVEVPSESKAFLQQAAVMMKQLPAGTVVQISGFSDSTGNPAVNMKLSQRRANAVRQVLVNAGVNPAKLVATGYGSSVSVVSANGTREGRSSSTVGAREERRVEFRIAQQ